MESALRSVIPTATATSRSRSSGFRNKHNKTWVWFVRKVHPAVVPTSGEGLDWEERTEGFMTLPWHAAETGIPHTRSCVRVFTCCNHSVWKRSRRCPGCRGIPPGAGALGDCLPFCRDHSGDPGLARTGRWCGKKGGIAPGFDGR